MKEWETSSTNRLIKEKSIQEKEKELPYVKDK